ncbi:MAG TPA: hypothetical protein VKR32_05040 [Puia sp.]|nr:hypothetical protein [Puia sp.]
MNLKAKEKCLKLMRFIDHKAFSSVLKLSPQTYRGRDKVEFISIQVAVKSEKKKIHACKNPAEIKKLFLDEICPETIRENPATRLDLHCLSSLPEIKEEFLALCESLEVN